MINILNSVFFTFIPYECKILCKMILFFSQGRCVCLPTVALLMNNAFQWYTNIMCIYSFGGTFVTYDIFTYVNILE